MGQIAEDYWPFVYGDGPPDPRQVEDAHPVRDQKWPRAAWAADPPTASKKVLTENLRELEHAGLIVHRDFGETVHHVEYDFSEEVRPEMQSMLDHLASFSVAVHRPSADKCNCASR